MNCKKCGTGKAAQRAGDWCCPNPQCVNNRNCVYGSKTVCPKCGCPKPAITMNGGKGNGMGNGMGMGMMNQPVVSVMGANPPREGDWHCPNAACKNHTGNVVYGSKSSCPLCGTDKPAAPVMAATAAAQFMANQYRQYNPAPMAPMGKGARPGDWNCPNPSCKNHVDNVVYGSKDICPLCATPKPTGVEQMAARAPPAAGRPIPNMRPGDWHCPNPSCKNHTANIIYASKTQCPLCNTPSPALDGRVRSRSPRGLPI